MLEQLVSQDELASDSCAPAQSGVQANALTESGAHENLDSCDAIAHGLPVPAQCGVTGDGLGTEHDEERDTRQVNPVHHGRQSLCDIVPDGGSDSGTDCMVSTSDDGSSSSADHGYVVESSLAGKTRRQLKQLDSRRFVNIASQKIHGGRLGTVGKMRCGRAIKADRYRAVPGSGHDGRRFNSKLMCGQCFGSVDPATSQESESD